MITTRLGYSRSRPPSWLLISLVAFVACSDRTQGPIPPQPAPEGVAVSEPIGQAAAAGAMAVVLGEVYVSTSPGTFPGGVSALVTNTASGQSVPAAIVEGGFDPVAVNGSPGDQLEIAVSYSDGTTKVYAIPVPETSRPRVVRTRPTRDAVDVPLNSIIIVVFSEPMDSATVTPQELRLDQASVPVAGSLKLAAGDLRAELTPSQPLQPATDYTLEIGGDIADRAGEALEAPVTVQFRTLPALRNQIAFTSRMSGMNGDVYLMNRDGSGMVNLTNHPAYDGDAAVSPDGTRILFTSDRSGDTEIYVMNADGSGVVNLSNTPGWDGSASWSPDGAMIAFVSYRDTNGQVGCAGGTSPVLWPCPDVFVMNADGSNPVNLTNSPLYDDGYPVWSPDGTRIAFASNLAEPDSVPGSGNYSDIFLIDPDGSNRIQLTSLDGPMLYAYWPTWSPDGTQIAFTGGPGTSGIWVMNADGSNPVRLSTDARIHRAEVWPSWSPDGSQIAFRSCDFATNCADHEVFVMNADGSNPVNLTNRPQFDDAIGSAQAWSP